jgi:hypothetical protein
MREVAVSNVVHDWRRAYNRGDDLRLELSLHRFQPGYLFLLGARLYS